jgi:hypothetical protein
MKLGKLRLFSKMRYALLNPALAELVKEGRIRINGEMVELL